MVRRYLTTIERSDVGRSFLWRDYRPNIYIASAIGRVQRRDVGKRVYSVDGVVQVENDEQRDKRLNGGHEHVS